MKNTAAPTATETFSACVTPSLDGLNPRYEVMVYRMVRGGICGPFSEDVTVNSLAEVDAQLAKWGFKRTGEFGPVCTNGFAEASLALAR